IAMETFKPGFDPENHPSVYRLLVDMAEWARAHLAAQRAEEVRDWAVQQYPSGTPLDQDRRMVAAETEAYLSGRTEREMSELAGREARRTGRPSRAGGDRRRGRSRDPGAVREVAPLDGATDPVREPGPR